MAPEAGAEGQSAPKPAGRRRVISFVTIFLAATVGLLTAYHHAFTSPALNTYLFYVAKHTAWTLSFIGDEADLETVGRAEGAEQRARQALYGDDWEPPEHGGGPLTAYESWLYRVHEHNEELARAEERLAHAAPVDRPATMPDLETHMDYVEAVIDRLEASLARDGEADGAPGLASDLEDAREVIRVMREQSGVSVTAAAGVLEEVEAGLEQLRQRQEEHLRGRVVQLTRRAGDMGPHVEFVLRADLPRQIRNAERELAALRARENPPEDRIAAVQERIADLRAELAEKEEAGEAAAAERERAFHFAVVPDCGAIPTMVIFFAAVIAFPAPWWKRGAGVLLGLPILYAVNVFRLACLGVLGAYTGPGEIFDFAHHYVWQGVYIIFVVAVWLLWMEFIVKGRGRAPKPEDPA